MFLDLLVHSQMEMAYHELVALNSDPHDGDLRAAVGIERGQMGERSFFDHFAYCLRESSRVTLLRCFRQSALRRDVGSLRETAAE